MPRKLAILDIDVECLPGHWIGGDFVSKIITAVAWKWIGSRSAVQVVTHYGFEAEEMAVTISQQIEQADIVTGHYIRGFDLPLINGNLLRGGYPPLGRVLAHDTKQDLIKTHGRSLSQKNLAALIGVRKPKIDVTLEEWERFNLGQGGYELAGINRVTGDVKQNIEMRERLLELGWLGRPQAWDDTPSRNSSRYHG